MDIKSACRTLTGFSRSPTPNGERQNGIYDKEPSVMETILAVSIAAIVQDKTEGSARILVAPGLLGLVRLGLDAHTVSG
jgi:hypothetical protein